MKLLKPVIFAAVFALCLALVQNLLMPKYMSGVYEGALISEYYEEDKNHQVIFIGDCEVYENFSPITLWENYGVTSYIRGGPQQLVWQSYYLLEDTLKYEKPDIVVFSVLALKYGTPQNEAYNRLNIDGMRLSLSKLNAVKASMTDGEDMLSYFFPILRYHDRWSELSSEDFKYFFRKDKVSHNGFMMRADVKPIGIIPDGPKLASYELAENCYYYLDKMTELCRENGIELVLVKAPSIYPHWYDEWDAQMVEYAKKNSLLYINFLDLMEDAGIDLSVDTYDAGLHLNVFGAEKLSQYFGEILKRNFDLQDLRNNDKISKIWDEKTTLYNEMKATQLLEIEKFGEVRTFTYKNK